MYLVTVPDGKRLFEEYSTRGVDRRENDIILAAGLMIMLAGLLGIAYSLRFRPT